MKPGRAKVSEQLGERSRAHHMRDHFKIRRRKSALKRPGTTTSPVRRRCRWSCPVCSELEQPVTLRGELPKCPSGRDRQVVPGSLTMRPLGRSRICCSYALGCRVVTDLVLGYAWQNQDEVTVQLPARFCGSPAARAQDRRVSVWSLYAHHRAAARQDRHRSQNQVRTAHRSSSHQCQRLPGVPYFPFQSIARSLKSLWWAVNNNKILSSPDAGADRRLWSIVSGCGQRPLSQ